MEEERKKRVLWKKITVGVLLLIVVSLSILILNINTIARNQINKTIDRYLKAGGNLETFNIYLFEGKVILSGLVINSPPGFETHPLLSLNNLEVNVAPWALLSGKVVVEDLTIYGLSINIVRNKKGRLSILELMVDQPPGTENQSEKPQQDEVSPWIPVVHAHVIQVGEVSFRLVDRMLNKDWSASLRAGLKVEELQLQDFLNLDILVGSFNLALNNMLIDQPSGFSKEPLLAINKIDVSSSGIDLGQSKVDISDVMLDTVSVSLERNADREVNLLKLAKSWLPLEKVDNSNLSASASVSSISSGSEFKFPAVAVDNIHLKSMSARLLDSIDGQSWRAGFERLDLQVKGMTVEDLAPQAISLASLDLDLNSVTVDQLPGFSETPLLSMGNFKLVSREIDLGESKASISDVNLDTLSASLERNTNNELNLLKLKDSWLPDGKEDDKETLAQSATPTESSGPALAMPSVEVDRIQLNSISAQMLASIEDQPWRAGFDGLDIGAKSVKVGDLTKMAVSLTSLEMGLRGIAVDQPPGFSETPLLAMGKLTLASQGIDLGNAKVSISDVTLDSLDASLERNADREINLMKIAEAWLPAKKSAQSETSSPADTLPESSGLGFDMPVVMVDNIHLNTISAQLLDSMDGQLWRAGFDGLDIRINNVKLGPPPEQAVSLASLDLDLQGFVVDQPPGFSETPLVSMDSFKLASQGIDLGESKVTISDVTLDTLSASLERNAEREINLQKLITAWLPERKSEDGNQIQPTSTPSKSSEPGLKIPFLVVDNVQLNSINAQLLDSIDGQPWQAGFDGMDIGIKGVEIADLTEMAVSLTSLDMGLRGIAVDQPPGFSKESLLAINKIDVSSSGIDLGQSKVSISDINLDTLRVSLERNAEREINVIKLAESWLPEKKENEGETPAPSAVPTESSNPALKIPSITVENVHLNSISAQLLDSMDSQPWRAGFDGLDIQATGLEVGDLAEQAITLASFDLDLKGVAVDQLPGFSTTPLLGMNRFRLASPGIDLRESKVAISDVSLDRLSASLERNTNNELNLLKLKESWLPARKEDDINLSKTVSDPVESPGPGFKPPAVVVDNIQLNSISAQFLAPIEDHLWRAGFDGLDILITGVDAKAKPEQVVSLASFDLDLKGVKVDQLPGFGERKLFGLEQFTVISEKAVKPGEELVVKQVQLKGLTSSVTMRADGTTNLKVLGDALIKKGEDTRRAKAEKGAEKETPSARLNLQPVLLEHFSLDGGPVTYRDEVFTEEHLEANLDDIKIDIKGLRFFTGGKDVKPASASMSFELAQPGDLPTAYFGTLAKVGPVGDGVPMINSQVRLVGLKLDTLGSLVTKRTRAVLGASGLDGGMSLAMDAKAINLRAGVLTDHGIEYKGLRVTGPLDAPIIKPGPIMAGALGRISDGMVNLGMGGLKTGVNVAEGGVEVVKELGTGAVDLGVNLGKSLFSATVGIVTLDKEKVKEGASGTTKGTVDITKDFVKGSGKAAGDSMKKSTSDLKGEDRVKAWEQDIPSRYEAAMQHARKVLAEMPYPPVTK